MGHFECIELEAFESDAVIKFKDKRVTDASRIEILGKELEQIAKDDGNQQLRVDFDNVKFISSAAISKLVVFEKRIRANGGRLSLSNLKPEVRDVFRLTKLDSVFEIED